MSNFSIATLSAQDSIFDRGDFILEIQDAKLESDVEIAVEIMERRDIFTDFLDGLNDVLSLNEDVKVSFASWPPGEKPNAVYFPDEKTIVIGYGLISELINLFDEEDFEEADPVLLNVMHTLMHETGHALIHVNEIPLGGDENEERIVDQLAFIVMSEFSDSEEELFPIVAAYILREDTSEWNVDSVHVPDEQRGLDYLCWMVGRNPDLEDADVREILGDRECMEEYEALDALWMERLTPSLKYSDDNE